MTGRLIGLLLLAVVWADAAQPLNVHIVCHTHDDVGWLKTVDQYYYGANNSIQLAGVQYILDSVVPELMANPARTFIYVETAFFARWWREQTPQMQQNVRQLLANGQLEFINGGWCMNDEATPNFVDIVDQMTYGHAFLKAELGVVPKIGWHIDPFGHSATQAELFAQMGFEAFFIVRIDAEDKALRMATRAMELLWSPSPSLQGNGSIFTSILVNHYSPPPGFCYDLHCSDPPVQDDPRLVGPNLPELATKFATWCLTQGESLLTRNLLVTMGDDFNYMQAGMWFKNLDKLLGYIAQHPELGINAFYSTPSKYVDAVRAANPQLPVKTDDFFPYADYPHAYWTGYFTSRPALKGYVRRMSGYLQACRQLEAAAPSASPLPATSDPLSDAMGLAQHHDAVAGTEKQHVAYDYAMRLSIGEDACTSLMGASLSALGSGTGLTACPRLNESVCPQSQALRPGSILFVTVYNALMQPRTEYVRLPLSQSLAVTVTSLAAGNEVVPSGVSANAFAVDPAGGPWTLTFEADLPALSAVTYRIAVSTAAAAAEPAQSRTPRSSQAVISNKFYSVSVDSSSGTISGITNLASGVSTPVVQQLMWYNSSTGNNLSWQPSGAYIFRPNGTLPFNLPASAVSVQTNAAVSEATADYGWAKQSVRLYANAPFIEVEYQVGPIPFADGLGKELVARYSTAIPSNGTWFTDSNGREMRQRIRNHRATWPLLVTEPVAGNYYPVNNAIFLQNNEIRFTVVTDRSQGGASLADGQLEVMLHRRLQADDGRGVGEPLNETGTTGLGLVIRCVHRLMLDVAADSALSLREDVRAINNPHWAFFGTVAPVLGSVEIAAVALDPRLHLVTLQQLSRGAGQIQLLLRLAHEVGVDDDSELGVPVTVNLGGLFSSSAFGQLTSVTELALTAQQTIASVPSAGGLFPVTISPMEIRTFAAAFAEMLE